MNNQFFFLFLNKYNDFKECDNDQILIFFFLKSLNFKLKNTSICECFNNFCICYKYGIQNRDTDSYILKGQLGFPYLNILFSNIV